MSLAAPSASALSADSAPAGIAAIGVQLPSLALPVAELAALRGVPAEKYLAGLGCGEIALCAPGEGVVELAAGAARRALARWGGDPARIGLLAVGSESALDMSRPLSAWVADKLGLRGALRSYEVKHACYGGTLALRQALEWRLSGAARGRAALVVAADVALYRPEDPGEPTQGAGAVAMVVDDARVAKVGLHTYAWSEPAFDFWRPVGEAFPRVDGPYSLDCYRRGAARCFAQAFDGCEPAAAFGDYAALCFHVPFPKMVKKAFWHIGQSFGLDEARIAALYAEKVEPTMALNRRVGNAYTASLWLSVADALRGRPAGAKLAAFSYGSGFGAELLALEAGPAAAAGDWGLDVEADLGTRRTIGAAEYQAMRARDLPLAVPA